MQMISLKCEKVSTVFLQTFGAVVIHKNDLLQQLWRRSIEHTVYRAQQSRPNLIHKAEDHTGTGQVIMNKDFWTSKWHKLM